MNKQEILEEINKTKEHLSNMEKMLEEYDYERWEPREGENYWYINGINSVADTCFIPSNNDIKRFNNHNCFKTKEQAEADAEKILIRRRLEYIARRLNKGEKVKWNGDMRNYSINFDHTTGKLTQDYNLFCQRADVYCLDENFLQVAIQEIGEERLKKYLRGE